MKDSGVIFLKDWKPLVSSLSIENQIYFWELFTSYEYGVEQKCDNEFVKPIWNFIKSQLDNMKEKYNEKVVERNKANGSKGGRPRKPKETKDNPKNPVGLNETQKTHKDKDKDKGNENENNNENVYSDFNGIKYPTCHIEHAAEFMGNSISLETFMMQNKIPNDIKMKSILMDYLNHLNIESKIHDKGSYNEFKKHFLNWVRKLPKEDLSSLKSNKKSQKLPDGVQPAEWLS